MIFFAISMASSTLSTGKVLLKEWQSENIKVINLNLFSRIFALKGQYQTMFTSVIDLKYDLESIKELYESTKIALHDTTELKNELKQKGWFFLT